jgi:hypothetical protein
VIDLEMTGGMRGDVVWFFFLEDQVGNWGGESFLLEEWLDRGLSWVESGF